MQRKSGGFSTPQSVPKLIAKLALHKQTTTNKIYDPAASSGLLLLQAKKPFDAIVSNPSYSISRIGCDDPTLINDDRFAPAGVLSPKSKADFAFVLHSLSYLSSKGRAAVVCFPGIF